MVPATNLLAFALAALLLIAVPGPSVLFVIGRTLALGRRGGLLSVLGNAAGELLQIAAVALGVGVVLAPIHAAFQRGASSLARAISFTSASRPSGTAAEARDGGGALARPASTVRILREGFIVGATNPKSVVFFVAVLPQFVDYSAGAMPLQLATLGALFLAIALASDSGWALIAGTARRWFASSPRRIAALGTAGGAMMIGLGGTLALAGNAADPLPGK